MTGLTERAGDFQFEPNEAIQRAHQAWEESMIRQVDALREEVRQRDAASLTRLAGANLQGNELHLSYWGRQAAITLPGLEGRFLAPEMPFSVFDLSLLLYYLKMADGMPLADRWISFRELPGGAFYNQAFQGYSGDRLAKAVGEHPRLFEAAAKALGGERLSGLAEYAYAFQPLPMIRLAAVLWLGDDEFPSRAAVLFDAAASHYMTTDGLAVLGSGLVSRIIKRAAALR